MSSRALVLLAVLLAGCAGSPPPPPPPPPPRVDPAPLFAEALAAREGGELERARSRLEAAVAADPRWDLPRLELAELLLDEGRDRARAEALLAAPAREENPRLHRLRGVERELAGDDAAAADHYASALALRADPELRFRRALVLDRLGRADEAVAELERVRAERPGDLAPLARLADLYERLDRLEDAERLLAREANQMPPRVNAWLRLLRFYERTGQDEKARAAELRIRALEAPPARELRPLAPSRR